LGARAAVEAVVHVENRLVRHAAAHIVVVARLSIEDRVLRGDGGVMNQPLEQWNALVRFTPQHVPQAVGQGKGTQRAQGVREERMRAVERVNVAATIAQERPACRLHGPAHFQCQLAALPFELTGGALAFPDQAPQVSVSAHVVKPVVVHPEMRKVRRHDLQRVFAAVSKEPRLARGVELQQGGAKLEPLRPLRPGARGVAALDRNDGGALGWLPGLRERMDLRRGEFEQVFEPRPKAFECRCCIQLDHSQRRSR